MSGACDGTSESDNDGEAVETNVVSMDGGTGEGAGVGVVDGKSEDWAAVKKTEVFKSGEMLGRAVAGAGEEPWHSKGDNSRSSASRSSRAIIESSTVFDALCLPLYTTSPMPASVAIV